MEFEDFGINTLCIGGRETYEEVSLSEVRDIPVWAMREQTRYKLTELLDIPAASGNDWKLFAQLCGVDYTKTEYIETKVEKTRLVLRELPNIQQDATFGTVLDILDEMERLDARDAITELLLDDAESYRNGKTKPFSPLVPPMEQLAQEDLEGKIVYFDAFVSSHVNDIPFQRTLIEHLEVEDQFKVCIPDRDLLTLDLHRIAKVIQERCKRVLVVISKSYLSDNDKLEQLAFDLDMARALSPAARKMVKVIPIIIDKGIRIPITLKPYVAADYTRQSHSAWFWTKLAASLKQPLKQDPDRIDYRGPDVPYVKLYKSE